MMLLGLESVISLWAAQLSCYDRRDFTSHTVVELSGYYYDRLFTCYAVIELFGMMRRVSLSPGRSILQKDPVVSGNVYRDVSL